VPTKKKEKEIHSVECIFIMLWHPSISYTHHRAMSRTLGLSLSSHYNHRTAVMDYKFIKNKEF
jgi:hypothetical protein